MNTSTTIGLYDFLNMVVMGFLLLFPVVTFPTDAVFLIWLIPCFIVGLIYHKLMENTLGICMRNKDCMILKAYESVNGKENEKDSSKENYYKAYYFLMEKRLLGSIPILEAQAAFLRNILPILFVYGILSLKGKYIPIKVGLSDNCLCIILILLIVLCVIFLIFFWQLFKKYKLRFFVALIVVVLFLIGIFIFPYNTCEIIDVAQKNNNNSYPTTSPFKDGIIHTRKYIALTIFLFIIILPFLWYKTQMKIHELVWEGKKYLGQDQYIIGVNVCELVWEGKKYLGQEEKEEQERRTRKKNKKE